MCNTLLPGDFVFINKIIYGARLPNTPISIPYTDVYSEKVVLPYLRFPGKGNIQQNDLIAFNYPLDTLLPPDRRPVQIKRLIAIPGDTIQMSWKKIYVNAKKVILPDLKFAYLVKCLKKERIDEIIIKYNLNEGGILNDKGLYKFFLTQTEASELEKQPDVTMVKISYDYSTPDFIFNSRHNRCKWNHDNFDPLIVPRKNLTVSINHENIGAYETIISYYENNRLDINDSMILINNEPTVYYTFRNNYYVVLDDNRDNANDTRNWGFLPEEFIIGKATRIVFSANFQDPWWKMMRWNRLMKKAY